MSNSAPDTIDISYTNDTGSEYTFNTLNPSISTTITGATVGGIVTTDTSYIIDNSSCGTITLTDLDNFERDVLDLSEVEEMCKEYPGLKNVYEKFKHVYDLVKQDWVGKQKDDI
tara:strand:+ start:248 stop:589 length:342 start_codon:yes stop_codon:yes gene_type:complete